MALVLASGRPFASMWSRDVAVIDLAALSFSVLDLLCNNTIQETVYNAMHRTKTASEQVLLGNLGSMLHRQRSCASTIREQIEPTTLRVPTSHHVAYASCRLIPRYPDDITEIQGRLRCQHGA